MTETPDKLGARRAPQTTAPQPLGSVPKSLGSFIAGYKALAIHRAIHELNMTGIWQCNYYEHTIRNEKEFENIWDYIDTQNHPSIFECAASTSQ